MRKLLLPLVSILLFTACQKQVITDKVPEEIGSVPTHAKTGDIDVCHRVGNGSWHTINISVNALPAHLAHGDIVPDADGDGYTKANPCGNGNQDDCNDDNAAINPGATDICDNNIDDNCNGQIDENCIPYVTICNQVWMLKNLDVSTYRNGNEIPEVQDPSAWAALTTGAWCYYANITANGTTYSKLYNWYAVNDPRGLAPVGWHVASDAEWTTLANCLDGASVAGGKMKSTGTIEANTGLWYNPNTGATNSSGFTGLPGGFRYNVGIFLNIGVAGIWWTSTEVSTTGAWNRYLAYNNSDINSVNNVIKNFGFSVRCVRD